MNKIGDEQTLFMLILSDQIIILFPADTFSRKQLIFHPHYKRNKYKLLEKTIMRVSLLHQPFQR